MSQRARVYLINSPEAKLIEVKLYLCHRVKRACERNGWDQRQAAAHLGTSSDRMHLMDRLKVEKLTVNILFRYLASADPGFELLIALR